MPPGFASGRSLLKFVEKFIHDFGVDQMVPFGLDLFFCDNFI